MFDVLTDFDILVFGGVIGFVMGLTLGMVIGKGKT